MNKVYIVGYKRTPIGKLGGRLSNYSAIDLGCMALKSMLKEYGIPKKHVDNVYIGCVLQSSLGQNVARQISINSGISINTPATTINMVCGSGMESINIAFNSIRVGDADLTIAGGTESMSNAPFAIKKMRFGTKIGYPFSESSLIDTMVYDSLWDVYNNCHMGVTAEYIAKKYKLERKELDNFALKSQKKFFKAYKNNKFENEIVHTIKNGTILIDENPRPNITKKDLQKLKPAFVRNGVVTAGNSSSINDGAAVIALASEKAIKKYKLTPLAEIIGYEACGINPKYMGIAPISATKKLIKKSKIDLNDIDLFEINEAFASQTIAVKNELQIPERKLNIYGGAIALGHPVGASGCRILVTLLNALIQEKKNIGLATLCVGGGIGCSILIKRV